MTTSYRVTCTSSLFHPALSGLLMLPVLGKSIQNLRLHHKVILRLRSCLLASYTGLCSVTCFAYSATDEAPMSHCSLRTTGLCINGQMSNRLLLLSVSRWTNSVRAIAIVGRPHRSLIYWHLYFPASPPSTTTYVNILIC